MDNNACVICKGSGRVYDINIEMFEDCDCCGGLGEDCECTNLNS